MVATDEGEARRVVIMLSENVHRIGLTPTEEANAYRQLTLLEWTPEQISAVTAKPAERVRHALTLVTLPPRVRQAADMGDLDLAEAAALADFTQDPKVLDRILARGKGWGFTHAVAEERSKIERREAGERAKAELVLAGVRVTSRPKDYGYGSREVEASTLLDSGGNRLDADVVRARPGFAAFVDAAVMPPRVVVYCTDPEAWGYTRTRATSYVSEAAAAQRAREHAERQARAQALEGAAGVRRDFLAGTYGTAKGARAVHLDAWRAAMTDPASITVTEAMVPLLVRLAGCDPQVAAGAGPDRLTRVLVARWLSVAETNLDRLVARHWQADACPTQRPACARTRPSRSPPNRTSTTRTRTPTRTTSRATTKGRTRTTTAPATTSTPANGLPARACPTPTRCRRPTPTSAPDSPDGGPAPTRGRATCRPGHRGTPSLPSLSFPRVVPPRRSPARERVPARPPRPPRPSRPSRPVRPTRAGTSAWRR